jgi:hypothetical protein
VAVNHNDVAAVAKDLIEVNCEFQKVLYGEVRLKLPVAKLLRLVRVGALPGRLIGGHSRQHRL